MTLWYIVNRCCEGYTIVVIASLVIHTEQTLASYKTSVSTFWIEENLPKGSLIGQLSYTSETQKLKYIVFTELTQGKVDQYFHVDPKDGAIYAEQKIDREVLCENRIHTANIDQRKSTKVHEIQNQNAGNSERQSIVTDTKGTMVKNVMDMTDAAYSNDLQTTTCEVNFQVHMTVTFHDESTKTSLLNVRIIINDVNDNDPLFYSQFTTVQVFENSPIGSEFRLPQAYDADPGKNGVVSYMITRVENILNQSGGKTSCGLNGTEFFRRNIPSSSFTNYRMPEIESKTKGTALPFAGDYFVLRNHKEPEGSTQPFLRQIQMLDREMDEYFYFCLIAVDGGGRRGAMLGNIEVLDVNDNAPQWRGLPLKVSMPECASGAVSDFNSYGKYSSDLPGGEFFRLVTTLNAVDRDAGRNGQITYKLSEKYMSHSPHNLQHKLPTILIQENQVFLASKLDYEQARNFRIPVEAVDGGGLSNFTEIEVTVEDCNDHAPSINVIPLNTIDTVYSVSGTIRQTASDKIIISVLEEDSKYVDLATIMVHDLDENDNRYIKCTLESGMGRNPSTDVSNFGIDLLEPTSTSFSTHDGDLLPPLVYTLYKREGALLDREDTNAITLNILCSDNNAKTPHETRKLVYINIMDVNDNAPYFPSAEQQNDGMVTQKLYVVENEPVGTYVGSVYAIDADDGMNAKLHHSFVRLIRASSSRPATNNVEKDGMEYFELDASTGMVHTQVPLDRERNATFVCFVNVSDSGNPPLSSIIRLRIIVLDVNDSPPIFTTTPGENGRIVFSVNESLGKSHVHGRLIGQLQSTDADEGKNSSVIYEIVDGPVSPKGLLVYYRVTPKGKIYADGIMDREQFPEHQFTVRAVDEAPAGHQLTSTALVVINLMDLNDSPPVFVYPPPSGESGFSSDVINVSSRLPPGSVLYHIRATDLDEPRNTQLHFFIRSAKFLSDYFVLRPLSSQVEGSNTVTEANAELILANPLIQLPVLKPQIHNKTLFTEDFLMHDNFPKEYFVYIIAKDSETEPSHSSTARLRIHVYPDVGVSGIHSQPNTASPSNLSTKPSALKRKEIIGSHLLPMDYFQVEHEDPSPNEQHVKGSGMTMVLTMSVVIVCIFLGLFCFVAIVYIRGNAINSPTSVRTQDMSEKKNQKQTRVNMDEMREDIGCDDALSVCDQAVYLELINQRALATGCPRAPSTKCASADSTNMRSEHACLCIPMPNMTTADEYGTIPIQVITNSQYDNEFGHPTYARDAIYLAHGCISNEAKQCILPSSTESKAHCDCTYQEQCTRREDADSGVIELSDHATENTPQQNIEKQLDAPRSSIWPVSQQHVHHSHGICANNHGLPQKQCAFYSTFRPQGASGKPVVPPRCEAFECLKPTRLVSDETTETLILPTRNILNQSPKPSVSRSVTFGAPNNAE